MSESKLESLNILSGNSGNLDFSHDICNVQKLEYSISNFAGLLVPVNGDQRKGVNLIVYSIIDQFGSYLLVIQHVLSTLVAPAPSGTAATSLAAKLARGVRINVNNMLDTLLTFAINLIYRTIMQFIDGLWLFTNRNNALLQVKTILENLLVVIQDVKMLFLRMIKIGIQFLGLFISNNLAGDLNAMSNDLFGSNGIVKEFFRVIGGVMLRIVGLVLDSLGDFGNTIKKIIVGICDAAKFLNDVLKAVGSQFPTLDCSSIDSQLGLGSIRKELRKEQEAAAAQLKADQKKYGKVGGAVVNAGKTVVKTATSVAKKAWSGLKSLFRRRLLSDDNNATTNETEYVEVTRQHL